MKSMILHHCVDPHSFASSIKTKCFTRIKNKAPSHPLGVLIFSFPGSLGCLSASDRKWHKFYCLGNHQAPGWKRSVVSASQLERRHTCWHTAARVFRYIRHSDKRRQLGASPLTWGGFIYSHSERPERKESWQKIGAFLVPSIHYNKKEGLLETASLFFLPICPSIHPASKTDRQTKANNPNNHLHLHTCTPSGCEVRSHF